CSGNSGSLIDVKTLGFIGFAGYNLWTGYRKHEFFVWNHTVRSDQFFREQVLPVLENGSGNWQQGRQEEKLDRHDKEAIKELHYYLSENRDLAAGFVYNRSYNFYTQRIDDECMKPPFAELQEDGLPEMYPLNIPQTVSWDEGPRRYRL